MKRKIWLLFILSIVFYSAIHLSGHVPGLLQGKFTYVDERPFPQQLQTLTVDLLLAFLFSLSTYLFFFYSYPAKKYVLLTFGLPVSFLFIFLAGFGWNQTMSLHPEGLVRFFRNNILFDILYVIRGVVFYFVRYSRQRELQEKELQLQVRNAELSFLRSQVNPHFLFNNLNNIYSLVYRGSSEALNAIDGLSELLRYMLYNQSETIILNQEITYIEKFIALQQLRYESPTQIKISYPEEQLKVNIPPLLLIPFIENAFKHGAPSTEEIWLWVHIAFKQNTLSFECINKIGQNHKDQTGGIGIENVSKRLELLYPGRHSLQTLVQDDLFTVKLKLNDI
jgi:two-component system LytT family sensor kinase